MRATKSTKSTGRLPLIYFEIFYYRVYTWDKWDNCIFKNYIKEFLRIKIEASGWPDDCKDPAFPTDDPLPHDDDSSLELGQRLLVRQLMAARQKFIDENKERYDIDLRPEKIKSNPGLR